MPTRIIRRSRCRASWRACSARWRISRPARVGWAVAPAPEHTHTRVWIRRPDKMLTDPFGEVTVRANMHPGHQNPDAIGPSGPSDPGLTLLAVQSPDGRPIAVLANYSMHYFGAPAVSADYYGLFAEKLGPLIGAADAKPAFVGIMSQGTSGDQHWMDYSQPKTRGHAGRLRRRTGADRGQRLQGDCFPRLGAAGDAREDAAARHAPARCETAGVGARPRREDERASAEVACRRSMRGEQLWLTENPTRAVKLQALRVGELGIAIWPCEVFAISGLKIKAQSPLQPTMNIELANGEEGYIPPPELHPLGGYNTWSCRTAGLEAERRAEDRGGVAWPARKGQRPAAPQGCRHARRLRQAVLAAKPLAYWRLEEWSGPTALDATGARRHATYEPGVARWLEGPASPAFSGAGAINRCPHFAGDRLLATLKQLEGELQPSSSGSGTACRTRCGP